MYVYMCSIPVIKWRKIAVGVALESMKRKLAWRDASKSGKSHANFCFLSLAFLLPFHRQIESKADLNCTTV